MLDFPFIVQNLRKIKDISVYCLCVVVYAQRVPRTGWVYRNVKNPESVSDHMYRMAMMALTITDPTVDRDRYRCYTHTFMVPQSSLTSHSPIHTHTFIHHVLNSLVWC